MKVNIGPVQGYRHMLENWRKARGLHQKHMAELFRCDRTAVVRWEGGGMIQPRYFIWWHYHTEELDHPIVQIPGYHEQPPRSDDDTEQSAIDQLQAWMTAPGEGVRQNYCPPLFLLPPYVIAKLVKMGLTELGH